MRRLDVNIQGIPNSSVSNYEILLDKIDYLFRDQFDHIDELKGFKLASLEENGNVANVTKGFLLAYLIRRLIALARQVRVEKFLGLSRTTENEENLLSKKIEGVFNVEISKISEISRVLIKLVDEVPLNKIKKNKRHGKELALYAQRYDLKCYICGSEIDYIGTEDDYTLQLEHHIPRIHGGSKSSDNIFVSCKRCNQAKWNFINWQEAGFNLLHKHLINIEKEWQEIINNVDINNNIDISKLLEKHIDARLIYVVSSLCNYSCYMCHTYNDDSGGCYIAPKETDDYLHPLNLMILCEQCKDEVEKSSWSAGQLIPMVRISNVRN